ncbi:MAG: pyridoxamine 5'-phosphate oxidase family protein [Pirellulales bacterium]
MHAPTTTIDLTAMKPAEAWGWLAGALQAATTSARHGLHLFTLATVGADGQPDARTVVLRHVDAERREIRFHTDIRSPKAATIRRCPQVALHWYDPVARLQIRIAARASLHHGDDLARVAWDAAAAMSRACYSASAPGTAVEAFPPAAVPQAAADDAGFENFAVVACRFDAVEVLVLHAAGHQRARLDLGCPAITWQLLAP